MGAGNAAHATSSRGAVCFALGSVVLGIQYPFFFKLGYNRARPVTVIRSA
ncbi:MAG: hypothetical protein QM628_08100 [Propionicimonas sp.]